MKKFNVIPERGFTLAEVLITLVIVGIIASITIPSIVAQHQKRELETRFTKTYRTIMQAVNLAIAEHGEMSKWDWKEKETYSLEEKDAFVKKYFVPYLNVVKFCPSDNSQGGCFPNEAHMYLNKSGSEFQYTSKQPKVLLADGSSLLFSFDGKGSSRTFGINFDVNGVKKPNVIGRDLFSVGYFMETEEILPTGVYKINVAFDDETKAFTRFTDEEVENTCTSNGWNCTAKIIKDGFKMNY